MLALLNLTIKTCQSYMVTMKLVSVKAKFYLAVLLYIILAILSLAVISYSIGSIAIALELHVDPISALFRTSSSFLKSHEVSWISFIEEVTVSTTTEEALTISADPISLAMKQPEYAHCFSNKPAWKSEENIRRLERLFMGRVD